MKVGRYPPERQNITAKTSSILSVNVSFGRFYRIAYRNEQTGACNGMLGSNRIRVQFKPESLLRCQHNLGSFLDFRRL